MLFAVATPMHMIAPVNAGTLSVVCVRNSNQHDARQRARQAPQMMMNGSSQDWKFTTISIYTSTIENSSPRPSPMKDELHRLHLAAHDDVAAARSCFFVAADYPLDRRVATRRPGRAPGAGVDIDHRLHVVVATVAGSEAGR